MIFNRETKIKLLSKAIFVSYLSQFFGILISIFSIPILLNFLDKESFGIWSIIFGTLNYISISYLGIPSLVLVLVSQLNTNSEKYHVIKKYLFLVTGFLLILSISLFFYNYFFPNWFFLVGNVSYTNYTLVKYSVILMLVALMVRIISSVFLAAFSGFQKIYVIKIYELIFGIGAFLALLIAYFTKKNLITLSFYTALSSIIISLFISFHFFFFIKQLKIKKSKKKLDIISFSFLISHGSSFFKAGLISALIMISHNLIISHAVGISQFSSYSLAFRLITVSFLFSYFIGQANVALFGNILSSENISKVHTLYQIQFDLLSAAAGFVVIFLLFFSKDIIELWTHKEDLYAGINVILFLSLYGFFLVFINLYYSLITLVNNSSQLFKIVRYEYILNILLTSVFAKYFNLEGAAFALMLSALFILYFILPITIRNLSYKNLQFNPLYFNKNIIFLILFFVIVTYMTGYFNIPRLYKFFIFSLIVFLYIFCAWNFLMYDSKQLILKRIYRFNKNY